MTWEYPKIQGLADGYKVLLEDYTLGSHTVPKGFVIDGASVPWFMHWYADDDDELLPAATIHDYLYKRQRCTRKQADDIFYALLLLTGVRDRKALAVWCAVRTFGWWAWRKHR